MKRLLLSILAINLAIIAVAQNDTPFNGLILNGELKGVKARINLKNKDIHTTSNGQGRFGFFAIDPSDTLEITIKKEKYIVPISGRKSIKLVINTETPSTNFSAEEDDQLIAYGVDFVKNRDISNNPNVILGDVMRHYGYTSLALAIDGKIAGLSCNPDTGEVHMRGQTSLNLRTSALIICEGQEMNSINDIDIQQVDRVEAIPAPNAYGVKGANGVVIVYLRRSVGSK